MLISYLKGPCNSDSYFKSRPYPESLGGGGDRKSLKTLKVERSG